MFSTEGLWDGPSSCRRARTLRRTWQVTVHERSISRFLGPSLCSCRQTNLSQSEKIRAQGRAQRAPCQDLDGSQWCTGTSGEQPRLLPVSTGRGARSHTDRNHSCRWDYRDRDIKLTASSVWKYFFLSDIHRTFPDNILFKSEASLQGSLFNVLVAYGHHNKTVGYCQVKTMTTSACSCRGL